VCVGVWVSVCVCVCVCVCVWVCVCVCVVRVLTCLCCPGQDGDRHIFVIICHVRRPDALFQPCALHKLVWHLR
jgi:hypothetical protein